VDLTVRAEGPFVAEDRSWLGSAHGTTATRSITLDTSKFDPEDHYPDGFIKSGTVLGRVTADGDYGPYAPAATDGREVAAGFLFNSITLLSHGAGTPAATVGAPLLETGIIREDRLPTNHGLDAAARTDLAGQFVFRA
jgi:hypothetical protein